jgi:hypothetical protein
MIPSRSQSLAEALPQTFAKVCPPNRSDVPTPKRIA